MVKCSLVCASENLWKLREKIRSKGQSKERTPSQRPQFRASSTITTSVLFGNVINAGEAQGGWDRSGRVETQLKCSSKRCLYALVPLQFAVLYYWRPATLCGFYHRTLTAKTPTTSVWCCKKPFSITDILSPHHSLSHPFPRGMGRSYSSFASVLNHISTVFNHQASLLFMAVAKSNIPI